jgi:hypothetical protein
MSVGHKWFMSAPETFARARLAEGRSGTYGTAVFSEVETARLIDRALPA